MKVIWCLFCVFSEANQPNNNLLCWWRIPPTAADIKKIWPDFRAEEAEILARDKYYVNDFRTEFRLRQVKQGVFLAWR
jgi:hypothetical protein